MTEDADCLTFGTPILVRKFTTRARAWGTSGSFERHDTSERELWDRAGENGFGPRLQITIHFIWKFNRWNHFPCKLHNGHAKVNVKNHKQGMES